VSSKDDPVSSILGWDDTAVRMDEIRALEKRVVELKQKLVVSAASLPSDQASDELTFLIMRVGQRKIAVPVQNVDEVAQMPAVTPLQDSVSAILGLVDYHGRMLAVIDLAGLLGEGKGTVTIDKTLAVFSLDPHKFAVMIDEPTDVVTVTRRAMQVSNEVLPGAIRATGVLSLPGGESLLVFDVGSIALATELIGVIDSLEDR